MTMTVRVLQDLKVAEDGSYYTIRGTGGEADEWVNGYEKLLDEAGVGRPREWFTTTGAAVNRYAEPANWRDAFKDDLTFLMFPADGLNAGLLAVFRIRMKDIWFDDMVGAMRRGSGQVLADDDEEV